jgi:hypothetical protein
MTAAAGGGLIVSQAVIVPFFGATAVFTSAHGHWVRERDGRNRFTFVALIFDELGMPIGTSRVSGIIELGRGGQSFTGSATASTQDAAGNLIFGFAASLTADRIVVEP